MNVRSLYYVGNEYVVARYCLCLFCMNDVGFTKFKCTVNKGLNGTATRTICNNYRKRDA